jgi:chitinase
MPAHAVIGYWHNFKNPAGCPVRLVNLPAEWDVINVAFADAAPAGDLRFSLYNGYVNGLPDGCPAMDPCQFKQDIASVQAQGKIVNISLGGATGVLDVSTSTHENLFVTRLTDMINEWGFNGFDMDDENNTTVGSAKVARLASAFVRINANFPGGVFYSLAPEPQYVQGAAVAYGAGGIYGAYIKYIDDMRHTLDVLHVQLYNNDLTVLDTEEYCGTGSPYTKSVPHGTDGMVAMSKMLIEGFPYGSGQTFAPLPASQVAFGIPSTCSSAGALNACESHIVSTSEVANAFDCITTGYSCETIGMQQPRPDFRGVMSWSINWNMAESLGRVNFASLNSCMDSGTCGSGANNAVCGGGSSCTAESNSQFCSRLGKNCGNVTADDNCGDSRTVSCGSCTSPQTCGGGGTANVCGGGSCSAESNTQFCSRLGKNCGSVTADDNCGNSRTVNCGSCTSPQTCGGGGTANVCGGGSSGCSGVPVWQAGTVDPNNGDEFQHCSPARRFRAKNNPGPWETPSCSGSNWFWDDLGPC